MKLINWLINRYATPGLLMGSIFSALTSAIISLSALFNFNPYIKLNSGIKFGLTTYAKSIPIKINPVNPVPDTGIYYQTRYTKNFINIFNSQPNERDFYPDIIKNEIVYADTVSAKSALRGNQLANIHSFSINSFSVSNATGTRLNHLICPLS